MGATSSISVPVEQADKLSQESIRDFKDFEDSLCSKNLSSEELQALLTTKFTELLALEKKRASLMKPNKKALQDASFSRKTSSNHLNRKLSHHAIISGKAKSDSSAKPRGGSMRCCLDPESMRRVRLEERQRIHETYSSKRRSSTSNKKHTASAPLLPSSSVDSMDTMNEEFNKPGEWGCATHTDDEADNQSLRGIDLAAISSDVEHDILTDDESSCDEHDFTMRNHNNLHTSPLKKVLSSIPESYECRLCKKKFPSKALLDTHLTHSQIHRQALLELRKKYAQIYADVERMDMVGVMDISNTYHTNTIHSIHTYTHTHRHLHIHILIHSIHTII
ncbi:hypothetical protein EON65_55285 [archaeon]|nr:MAG: hypothetical protein EON65_55285 [archaeon]